MLSESITSLYELSLSFTPCTTQVGAIVLKFNVLLAAACVLPSVGLMPLSFAEESSSPVKVDAKPTVEADAKSAQADRIRASAQFLSLYFNELDCENVGYIQTGEADDHFAPIFLSSDVDSSRTLTRTEVINNPFAKNKALLEISFEQMDSNGNGSASPDELRDYLSLSVRQVDSDRNGDIYPEELDYALGHGAVQKHQQQKNSESKKAVDNKEKSLPPWERYAKAQKQHQSDAAKINSPGENSKANESALTDGEK